MTERRIYVDIDDVVSETIERLVELLDQVHGRRVDASEVAHFDLTKSFGLDQDQIDSFMERAHDDDFIESGIRKKGILVGNARMDLHPGERGEQFSEEVKRGADGQKFCLLPTTELFRLVQLVLTEGADRRLDLRKSLLQQVGVFTAPRDQPGNTPDDDPT